MNKLTMPFIEFRDGRNVFALLCPVCEAEGELGIKPDQKKLTECPGHCGALFMVFASPNMLGKPTLEYVSGGVLS